MKNLAREEIEVNPKLHLLRLLIRQCYRQNITHSWIKEDGVAEGKTEGDLVCPRTFDGFLCWDETPAGATAFQSCPGFVIGFDPKRYAYKKCMENGVWFLHPEGNRPWTNYTTCVDIDDLNFRSTVNEIYVGGYSISVAALILSLFIFFYFKSLHCTRIRVHMNLFTAFALNNILWIVWYRVVVNNATVVQENKIWCQLLHIVTTYFMVTGYTWMFCEGLHLHIALVVVFVKEKVAMRCFLAIGWGLSLVIIIVYAVVRYHIPGATERCWMEQSEAFWIITVPVVISLIASFVFLINVVRVLLTKLHPAPHRYSSVATKKAARAALILIPLFGLHFVLIPFRPSPDMPGEKLYQVVSALLTSLQGVCVAILFCFTNHDVVAAAKTYISRYIQHNDVIPMTGVTGGESIMNTRENIV
ncbi:calcitonin gene-related peptide type 1 receptor-like isoform X1 [Danaus plexippus]|uniref:calcitonin gene-related peptide type 1 receptor-like isoform X1 n=1 Tax=Danaus plexippus TaxID=13037 RepID=UPI002AB0A279|nr:calcitonin gene-related peptide type 1 receptor-like isoform X1 [Danaus plexippus]XP_061382458.1 calcitonin gene-related peptide type 1 receptor-like isoform X1 [Danaus plexippus]